MDIIKRMMLEARYIISLNKKISELVPIMHLSEEVIYNDINHHLKSFDKELYYRVISILQRNY